MHQTINIRHLFRIRNAWSLSTLCDFLNILYPSIDFFWIFVCVFYRMNRGWFVRTNLSSFFKQKFYCSSFRLIQSGFILGGYCIIFTNITNPKVSSVSSGRDIFRKASTSPTAGIYSGIKGFSFESISTSTGLYLKGELMKRSITFKSNNL